MNEDERRNARLTSPERFWAKVDKSGDCWVWTGYRQAGGYGQVGRSRHAHRVAWELTNGPIPDGMHVLHSCDNPPCVRPHHLHLGTHAENMAEAAARGRSPRGSANAIARLDPDKVRAIRSRLASGESQGSVASSFGVHRGTVLAIHQGKTWRWVA